MKCGANLINEIEIVKRLILKRRCHYGIIKIKSIHDLAHPLSFKVVIVPDVRKIIKGLSKKGYNQMNVLETNFSEVLSDCISHAMTATMKLLESLNRANFTFFVIIVMFVLMSE